MSSARNHWILDRAAAFERSLWPVEWPPAAGGPGTPREYVACSNRHRPPDNPDGTVNFKRPAATHAAGFDFITGKRGRLGARLLYLCPSCADRFRSRYGAGEPRAGARGGWNTGPFLPMMPPTTEEPNE